MFVTNIFSWVFNVYGCLHIYSGHCLNFRNVGTSRAHRHMIMFQGSTAVTQNKHPSTRAGSIPQTKPPVAQSTHVMRSSPASTQYLYLHPLICVSKQTWLGWLCGQQHKVNIGSRARAFHELTYIEFPEVDVDIHLGLMSFLQSWKWDLVSMALGITQRRKSQEEQAKQTGGAIWP